MMNLKEPLPVLVIGGGPAGLSAAGDLADLGLRVILVERRERLGGAPIRWNYNLLAPAMRPMEEVMGPLIGHVESNPLVAVHTNSSVESCEGVPGAFKVVVKNGKVGASSVLVVSSVIVSTGFEHFDASVDPRYGYGSAPDVIAIHELRACSREGG